MKSGLSRNDRRRVALAARAAGSSNCKQSLGAVVVAGGRVMAAASNRYRNSASVTPHEHCTVHAEEAALRLAGEHAAGATLYVTRVNRQGEWLDSRPCVRCHQQIVAAGISRIVYMGEDGDLVSMKPDRTNVPAPRKLYEHALISA